MDKTELFVCQCNDASHQLILSTLGGGKEVYADFHLENYGFCDRLKNALKYIAGIRRKDGDFDSLLFKNEDLDRLEWFAEFLDDGSAKEVEKFEAEVTTVKNCEREWKETVLYRWTFDSKDNTYEVIANEQECLSDQDSDYYINICVYMKAASWYKRVVRGIKHIFGYRSCYGDFDSFVLTPDAVAPLRRLIEIGRKWKQQ